MKWERRVSGWVVGWGNNYDQTLPGNVRNETSGDNGP